VNTQNIKPLVVILIVVGGIVWFMFSTILAGARDGARARDKFQELWAAAKKAKTPEELKAVRKEALDFYNKDRYLCSGRMEVLDAYLRGRLGL
jgi:hypothetical protein